MDRPTRTRTHTGDTIMEHMKHTFKTTLSNGTKVANNIDVPTGANAFDVDAWRRSGLFNPDDSPETIGAKIVEHVASNATIVVQRALRSSSNGAVDQTSADAIVAGFRLTRSVSVRHVPRSIYDTFTDEQRAFMEKDGTMLVPVDDEPKTTNKK